MFKLSDKCGVFKNDEDKECFPVCPPTSDKVCVLRKISRRGTADGMPRPLPKKAKLHRVSRVGDKKL